MKGSQNQYKRQWFTNYTTYLNTKKTDDMMGGICFPQNMTMSQNTLSSFAIAINTPSTMDNDLIIETLLRCFLVVEIFIF